MSKKPTGLTISRSGGWFSASWKCGDKNYSGGQQFQYNINSRGWASLSIGTGTRAKGFDVGINGYYPNTGALLYTVSVRVRGKVRGGSWSAWTYATYTTYAPNAPSLDVSVDEQHTNVCTFSWNLVTDHADAQPFLNVLWESILVKESDVTDGSQLVWGASATGWDWGLGYDTGTITKTEDTTLLADASYTRWFRVCARGARGGSAWTYAKHVYARPFQAKIEYADMSVAGAEGMSCYARWTADQTPSHPIDHTTVQYLITVPNADLACPSGAQWSDANISADTSASDAVRFSIDNVLDKDECLFIRVNTIYGQNTTYSSPKLAAVGNLKDPTDLSYQVDNTNHTLTSVSVDNNSDVPDSFIAIVYRAGSNPEDELVVGIIPHGASQPLVTPVQCPDWSGESAFSIGAYAAVGTYEANSIGYTVNAKMRSASTIWVGGAVPVAPENVNVVQSPITGTATVTWDWTWEEANFAQLSWTDHDDAWESTDEPEIYNITKPKATKWNISGLELGKKWYIAVRLVSGNPEEENVIYSPWSDMRDIILSSVPNVPSLNLSAKVITEGEEITASWDFVSNDGTGQISAEIKDEDDNLIAHTETQKEVVIDTEALGWSQGETHGLSVRVTSGSNRTTEWSNPVSIVVAEALSGSIADTSLETVEINPRSFEKTDFLSFLTEQEEVFTKLQVDLDPIQDLHGYDAPWQGTDIDRTPYQFRAMPQQSNDYNREYDMLVGGTVAWNQLAQRLRGGVTVNGITITPNADMTLTVNGTATGNVATAIIDRVFPADIKSHRFLVTESTGATVGGTDWFFFNGYVQNGRAYENKGGGIITHDGTSDWTSSMYMYVGSGVTIDNVKLKINVFDLTQMFGSAIADYIYSLEQATAGAGVAWFKKLFPKPYYAYNAGELMSVQASSHDMVGFNAWDEVTESGYINNSTGENVSSASQIRGKNYIPVIPNTTYYFKSPTGLFVYFYDANKEYIGVHGSGTKITNNTITLGADVHYIRISMPSGYGTTYKNDICINLSWDGERDGEYEAYVKHSYPLDSDLVLRGIPKLDANNNLYYDGDTYESDGSVTRKYGIVDLGTLTWNYDTSYTTPIFTTALSTIGGKSNSTNCVVVGYTAKGGFWQSANNDKCIACGGSGFNVSNLAYTDAATFKTAMSGVYLIYELATPTTETADPYTSPQVCDPDGTEEYVTISILPVGHQSRYALVCPISGHTEVTVTVADDADDPTVSEDYTTALGRTVYGGTLDVVSGVLTVTWASVDFGSLGWASNTLNGVIAFYVALSDAKLPSFNSVKANIMSSAYEADTANNIYSNTTSGRFSLNTSGYIQVRNSNYSDASTFKTAMTGQTICYELATPQTYQLTPQQIQTLVGQNNMWSEDGEIEITIAEKSVLSLTQMPLTVELSGVDDNVISTLTIERTADYHMDRPDETQFDGFEGEIVYLKTQNGGEDIVINREDLIGLLDDGAFYRVYVTFKDVYGQSMSDSVDFEVHWDHQAIVPEASVEIDEENLVAKLTPIAPTGTLTGDTCDIYRLSADRPELIVKDAVFGTQYVDPYPAIGEFGGHRFVFKTVNGDYITATNDIAWTDTGLEEGDILESERAIIDFDGNQLLLYYNVDVGHQWDKDFQETKYLGGSVQGDWNAGVSRSGSISATMITLTDAEQIRMMRELAVYTGVCHVRTTDGSSYTADVQVSEDREHDDYGKLASFSLTITRVDAETLDGLTYQQWAEEEE